MKIVMIHGQNHKGSTWNIANLLLQKLPGEKEVKEYFLPRDLNHFCSGCYACLEARERVPIGGKRSRFSGISWTRIF